MRTLAAERAVAPIEYEDNVLDYDENMTGGDMSDDYMNYGGG
jgi:hypothetical protein